MTPGRPHPPVTLTTERTFANVWHTPVAAMHRQRRLVVWLTPVAALSLVVVLAVSAFVTGVRT